MELMQNAHCKWRGHKMLMPNRGKAKYSPHMKVMQNAHSKWRGHKMVNQYGGNAKILNQRGTQNGHLVWN